jgi:hypothetical protein
VRRDAAARLAQEQPPQRVVGLEREHPVEDGRAGRRQDAADDDVADLAACVTADDRDDPRAAHGGATLRGARLAGRHTSR